MKLVVCAKSDRGSFIGLPSAARYSVFFAPNAAAIRPGDILSNPAWDDDEGTEVSIRNLTTAGEVRIEILKWSLDLDEAKRFLLEEGGVIQWHPPWPG